MSTVVAVTESNDRPVGRPTLFRALAILALRIGMIVVLLGTGWFVYKQLPASNSESLSDNATTDLQIMLRSAADVGSTALDIPIELYPVDIVAVRHEFFTEPRAGKRFEDFLKDRMKGRSPVSARLDKQGRASVALTPGNWWLHAKLSGEEEVEWRLPVTVTSEKQTIELTPQNAYTRSKTF